MLLTGFRQHVRKALKVRSSVSLFQSLNRSFRSPRHVQTVMELKESNAVNGTETRVINRPPNALVMQPEDKSLESEAVYFETCEDKSFKHKAYNWCKSYLGGTWGEIPEESFDVQYVRGGLTNYLYLCSLPDNVATAKDEERKVLIRIYGEILDNKAKFYEGVIFTLLSERGFGPHLFGVFSSGRIEQYIPSRHLGTRELAKPHLSARIAEKLGKYHSMELPLTKQPSRLWESVENWLSVAQNAEDHLPEHKDMKNLIREMKLSEEYVKLKKFLIDTNSKVIFCHNDVQERNILLLEKAGAEDDVLIIDYEYSSYNYRGFDIGNHFCEWMYDYGNKNSPWFFSYEDSYPNPKQQRNFAKHYLKSFNHCKYGIDKEPTEEEIDGLLVEANRFALASHFFWGIWAIVQARVSKIEFGFMDYGIARFSAYFRHKKIFWPDED